MAGVEIDLEQVAQGIELEAWGSVALGQVAGGHGAGIAVPHGGVGGGEDFDAGAVAVVLDILVQFRQDHFHTVGAIGKDFDVVGNGEIPQSHLEDDGDEPQTQVSEYPLKPTGIKP